MKVTVTITTAGEFPPREVAKFTLSAKPLHRERFLSAADFGRSLAVIFQSTWGVHYEDQTTDQ